MASSLNAQSRKRFSSRFTSAARLSNWNNASTSNRGSKRYLDGKSSVSTLESGGGGASFDLRPQDLPQRNLDLSDFATDDEFSVEYVHGGVDDNLGRKGVVTTGGPSRQRVTKIGRQIRTIITAPSPRAAMEQVQQDDAQDVQYQQVGGHDSAGSNGLVGVHVYSDEHDEKGEDNEDRRHGQHGHYQDNEKQGSDRLPQGGETSRSPKSSEGSGGGYCVSYICSCIFYTLCWVLVRLFMLVAATGLVYGMYRLILDIRKGEIQIAIPSIGPNNESGSAGDAIGEIGSSQIAGSPPPTPPTPMIARTPAHVEMSISPPPPTPAPFIAPTPAHVEETPFEQEEEEEIEKAEEEFLEEEEPKDHAEKHAPTYNDHPGQEKSSSNAMVVSLSAQNPSDIATPRFRLMHNAILQNGISVGDDLKPRFPITPQLRALDWIANVDPQESDIIEDSPVENSFPSYLYRYALATLLFSAHTRMDGKDATEGAADQEDALKAFEFIPWSDERGWMTGTGICFWSGVECTNADDIPTEIDLTSFGLDGTFPRELFTVFSGSLTSLRLARNKLRGTIPDEIGQMKSLLTLDLDANQELGGRMPQHLFDSVSTLKIVRLGQCSFSGDIPEMNLPDLEVFDVSWQGLTGTLPQGISDSKKLRVLTASGNSFVGNLPDISGMNDLVFLELNDNKFSGGLYNDLQHIGSLEAIVLEKNQLTGTIPERLVQHDTLEELVLGFNNLSGKIPTPFNLPKLRLLRLSNNAFEGSLPWETLVTYENLEQIDLAENRFIGTISGDFSRLVNLRLLSIFHNDGMRGEMPTSVCTLVNGEQSLEVLTKACGEELPMVECSCCNECWDG